MGVYELHGPSGTRRVAVSNVGEAPLTVLGAIVSDASGPFTVAVMDETRRARSVPQPGGGITPT